MRLDHDRIKEMLPDYLSETIQEEKRGDIETHLNGCGECRDEISFLKELFKLEAPDPGDFFWNTLPQRVRMTVKEEGTSLFSLRSFLLRQFPITATIIATLFLLFIYSKKEEIPESVPSYITPLTASVLDYSGITEKDIPIITEQPRIYELFSENFMERSYYSEFVSLSSKELEDLYEVLGEEKRKGG